MSDKIARLQNLDSLLLAAVDAAPRRYRMRSLPADANSAESIGVDASLAFAIEAARIAQQDGATPPASVQHLFTHALAGLIRNAFASEGGDPAFQARVLQAQSAEVREHVRLAAQAASDRRAVRVAIDAIAHPGKLREMPDGAARDELARLHRLATNGDWEALAAMTQPPTVHGAAAAQPVRGLLEALRSNPALHRLVLGSELLRDEAVQRYLELNGRSGPLAGSDAAAASGRTSARLGEAAEQTAVQSLSVIADLLNRRGGQGVGYRVVQSLRPPRGFPGETNKAKDEWDAAIVRSAEEGGGVDEIVLLVEIKVSPAAATSDLSRLVRGLQRLGQADANQTYVFASAGGKVSLPGGSLRRLDPHGHSLPRHVIYCCSAPAESRPQLLNAATKAVLLGEPESIAFAQRFASGEAPPEADLLPVWRALAEAPRLRSALYQYETARQAREAMLHPLDLLAAVREGLA